MIVFEGADEVGKTTLATMLAQALVAEGRSCTLVGFPGDQVGTLGRHVYELHHDSSRFGIRSINPTSLQILHVAAHVDAIENLILPALRKNRTVILDRFWWSTWVYGVAGRANKQSLEAAIEVEAIHWKGIRPTRLFLIERSMPLEPQRDLRRWQRVRTLYRQFASTQKRAHPITIVRNQSTPDAALAEVRSHLQDL